MLKLERDGAVGHLTMDNPPANVWDEDSLAELRDLFASLQGEAGLAAVILTGAGERFFSAGADLKVFAAADAGGAVRMAGLFGEAFEALAGFSGVSIAAINGFAMGGGLEAALACDIRIACPEAKLGLPEAKVGLLPCGGGTQALPALIGEGWAKRMILCGETVDAETAERIGLIQEVVPRDELLVRAGELAAGAAAQSPTSLRHCKRLVELGRQVPRDSALAQEREAFVKLWRDDNRREGCEAFLEKRPPKWK
ncbi:MAG: enoyl-CoA hydratase [Gammaproteobacteria bacterium AqS3]|nr:enoyl-CoA hydratase [Gammaproteobacteria bacterium AqS3]